MQIANVTISNFRGFKSQEFSFATGEDRNMSVIMGHSGGGKTTLLHAMLWGLFGNTTGANIKSNEINKNSICNSEIYTQLQPGGHALTHVEITLKDQNAIYMVKRTEKITKKTALDWVSDGSKAEVFVTDIKLGRSQQVPISAISTRILPNSLSHYFLFDGEKLNEFFDLVHQSRTAKMIEHTAKINLIDRVIEHINYTVDQEYKKHAQNKPAIERINKEINEIIKELGDDKDNPKQSEDFPTTPHPLYYQRKEIVDAREDWENRKSQLDVSLGKMAGETIEEQRQARKDKKDEIELKNKTIKNARKILLEIIQKHATYNLLKKEANLTLTEIESLDKQGIIPPDFSKDALQDLIDNNTCICGTQIHSPEQPQHTSDSCSSKEHKNIEKTMNEKAESGESRHLLDCRAKLNEQSALSENSLSNWDEQNKTIFNTEGKIGTLKEEIKEIDDALNLAGEEAYVKMFIEFKELEENLKPESSSSIELKVVERQILQSQKKLEEKRSERNAMAISEGVEKELTQISELMEKSTQLLTQTRNTMKKNTYERIRVATEKHFLDLMFQKGKYDRVLLAENTRIKVRESGTGTEYVAGQDVDGGPSSAEVQMLAYSFAIALMESTGFNFPLVIDTPLGRVDEELRKSWAQNMVNCLPESQIIMLPTKKEYLGQVEDILQTRVGHFRKLSYDTDNKEIVVGE